MDGNGDDASSDAEFFLTNKLCTSPGNLDAEKIVDLLKDEANHLPVMEALNCLLGYDIDMEYVEGGLTSEEVAEVRRIVKLLPQWAEAASASKKKKSA
jgi:hypothetical protein